MSIVPFKSSSDELALALPQTTPFRSLLMSQQDLIADQLDQLSDLVAAQCNLTGVNPVSQEMAAGALSIKIGKRPRDLLNPKAIKYMQSVFSIKDAVNKKESREISALFGVTPTQVREFFAGQRSRVRKFVRVAREKSNKSVARAVVQNGPCPDANTLMHPVPLNSVGPSCSDVNTPIHPVPVNSLIPSCPNANTPIHPVPLNSLSPSCPDANTPIHPVPLNFMSPSCPDANTPIHPVPLNFMSPCLDANTPIHTVPLNSTGSPCPDANALMHSVPLNSMVPISSEKPSCSAQDKILPGIDESDRYFVDNIFGLMRREEMFSGQVKLLEWILRVQNSSVLYWFQGEGAIMILATWLSQAAAEEQTSVLRVILKVLCHLPLHKALPAHMSAILQSVNKLRFYMTQDISNRAKDLLSRWSKMFARSQAIRKSNSKMSAGDAQDEMLLKQSIGEVMRCESWESKVDAPDGTLVPLYESLDNSRSLESSQPMKLLTSSADDSNQKLLRGVSSSQTRGRRKVQMVEQPGQRVGGRNSQVSRSAPMTQERPLSADDIQKAKMRAQIMQMKHGKSAASPAEDNSKPKIEGPKSGTSSSAPAKVAASPVRIPIKPKVVDKKPVKLIPRVSNGQEATKRKVDFDSDEPLWKKCKRAQISWKTPQEMTIDAAWGVACGENSKEVEIQKNRIRREKEVIYKTVQEIPLNPKEPWDKEMDYDDTLTLEIPIDQVPDGDDVGTSVGHVVETVAPVREVEEVAVTNGPTPGPSGTNIQRQPEPDMELLAVLLKNPELVFALQGGNLSSEQMILLLDMIKKNGVESLGSLVNGLVDKKAEVKVEVSVPSVSLPSPTPSSNPVTSGWHPDNSTSFSQQNVMVNGEAYAIPGLSVQQNVPASMSARQPRYPIDNAAIPQLHQRAHIGDSVILPSIQRNSIGMTSTQTWASDKVPIRNSSPLPSTYNSSPSNNLASYKLSQPSVENPYQAYLQQPVVSEPPRYLLQQQVVAEPSQNLRHSYRYMEDEGFASNSYSSSYEYSGSRFPYNSGHGREVNGYRGGPGLGLWNTDDSPARSQEYIYGRNYNEPRMNPDRSYRPDMSRPYDHSGYRDYDSSGYPRWQDRRR